MTRAGRLRAFALAIVAGGPATAGRADDALQPYQMVRSLQLVQDRIAAGDHAAMPMQAKLLEMIDARFRAARGEDFKEPKNLRALLVYGMSGGNPATIAATASRIEMDAADKAVAEVVADYLGGRPAAAIKAFEPVEPMTLPPDLGAFVALVKGSLLATEDSTQALRLLDEARLLSPGTLVEEAALRRSVGIAVETGDAARFALASTQYTERFLHSPYASQFADAFVSGVIALHMSISLDKVGDITAMMDAEREKVIYLRIARRAAIDGLADLSTFAAAKAERNDAKDGREDPRALLYASLSTMTSATVDDLRATLKKIDRSQLSDGDRSLLDAAEAITHEMTAPPAIAGTGVQPSAEAPAKKLPPVAGAPGQASSPDTAGASDLPPVEGVASERPATSAAPQAENTASQPQAGMRPAREPDAATPPPLVAAGQPATQTVDAADQVIADTKRQLDKIDQLLGASPQ
jgi:chemotaxis protein MotC